MAMLNVTTNPSESKTDSVGVDIDVLLPDPVSASLNGSAVVGGVSTSMAPLR
jgi:hypothetical protein